MSEPQKQKQPQPSSKETQYADPEDLPIETSVAEWMQQELDAEVVRAARTSWTECIVAHRAGVLVWDVETHFRARSAHHPAEGA